MVAILRPEADSDGTAQSLAWWALPIGAVLASYATMPTAGFVWDDYDLIVSSPLVTGQATFAAHFNQPFWSDALLSARSFYRPLITLSYACDHYLWGGWAGGYHVTNLVLHLACTLLVVALCLRAGGSRPVACLLATAFAVFPRLTESVAWISGRTDPAAAVGALGALLLYKPGNGSWGRKVLAGLALLAGLLCKEVALAAAVALTFYAWHASARPRRLARIALQLTPIWAALAVYVALRIPAMAANRIEYQEVHRTPLAVALSSTEALARYAGMLIDPLRPRLQIGALDRPQPLLSGLGVCLAIAGLFAVRRWSSRWTSMEWLAIALGGTALALVVHLIRLDVNVVAADRFLYIPVAALAIGVSATVERAWRCKRKLVLLGSAALLGSFTLATALRAQTWANEIALWRQEVKHTLPGNETPRIMLVTALMRRGRYDEALTLIDQISADTQSMIAINQATCLDKLGKRSEGIALLNLLLSVEPSRSRARINLMLMFARDRRFDEARAMGTRLRAEFSDRIDIKALIEQVENAAVEWAALPPEETDEPSAIRVRRAAWFARLDALPEAQSRWALVALDPRADTDLRLQAATYLALYGHAPEARSLLAALAAEGALSSRLPALQAALEERFDDE